MSARVIAFPQRSPFVVRVERDGPAWLVTCRSHGWLHGSHHESGHRCQSYRARVRRRREPLTNSTEFAQANTAAPEGARATAIPAPQLA